MERTLVRRGDYPNNFWTPYKWHLLGAEQLVETEQHKQEWHCYAACQRYELPLMRAEYTLWDFSVPDDEWMESVCKRCLRIIRALDSERASEETA